MLRPKGYVFIHDFLSDEELNVLREDISQTPLPISKGGIRHADKKFSTIKAFIHSNKVQSIARTYLGTNPHLVRAILFNKTESNNWSVAWHQDKTIAVSQRFAHPDWGPWSIKEGVHHVHPPIDVLNQMITFRIHLDDTNEANGCLKIIPSSQQKGILKQSTIKQLVQNEKPYVCEGKAGSVLIMRPHLLHSSNKASHPSQRRILHLEFSSYELPPGTSWA